MPDCCRRIQSEKVQEMIEKKVEDELRKRCEINGWQCLKLELNGVRGFPDRTILTPFGVFFVELKRPKGGVISPHQMYWRGKIRGQEQTWKLVSSLDEVERFIARLEETAANRKKGIR